MGTINGTGTLSFGANATNTGATIADTMKLAVTGGTFTLGASDTFAGLNNTSTVDLGTHTLTLTGIPTALGTINGTGTLIFGANATNTGANIADTVKLAVTGGTFTLGASDTFAALNNTSTINLANNSLTISGFAANLGTIADSGGGNGTILLAAGGTHSGANTIADSVNLQINGGSFTTVGAETINLLTNNGTLTLGGNTTTAAVANNGTLNIGSGFTHTMASLNVGAGGILTGSGVILGPVTFNGTGQLRPGNSIGTITANSFQFDSSDTIFMEVGDGTSSDRLAAVNGGAGTINFNNDDAGQTTIQISSLGTLSAGQHTYTLMTNDGGGFTSGSGAAVVATESGVANSADSGKTITGKTDAATDLSGYQIDLAAGDVGSIELVSTRLDAGAGILELKINVLKGIVWARNEIAASSAVTRLANDGHAQAVAMRTVLNGLAGDARVDAANQLTSAATTALPATSFALASQFKAITGHRIDNVRRSVALRECGSGADRLLAMADPDMLVLAQSPCYDERQMWFETFGNWLDQGDIATDGLRGFSGSSFGFTIGADQMVSDNTLLGITAGGAWTDVAVRDTGSSRGNTDNFMVEVYGSWFSPKGTYLDASTAYQFSNYTFNRVIPAMGEIAHGNHQGNMFRTSLELGRDICMRTFQTTPFLGFDYLTLHENGYTETGAPLSNLAINANTTTAWLQTLGMRFSKKYSNDKGWVIRPELSVAWVHDYGDAQLLSTGRFAFDAGNTQPLTITGYPMHRDRARMDAGLNFVFNCAVDGHVNYVTEFANRFASHTLEAGLNFKY